MANNKDSDNSPVSSQERSTATKSGTAKVDKPSEIKPRGVSKFLRLPDGSVCKPFMIASIKKVDTGVVGNLSNGDMQLFIPVADEDMKQKVVDLLVGCVDAGKKFVQPDWSFLTEEGDD